MAMELQASCCRRPICFSSSVKSHAALVVRIHAKLRRPHDLCTRAFIAVFPASFAPLAAAVCIEQEQLVAQYLGAPAPPESSASPCPLLLLFIEPPKSQQAAPRPLHLRHVPVASVARETSAAPCFL